jgi:hypothetical protein
MTYLRPPVRRRRLSEAVHYVPRAAVQPQPKGFSCAKANVESAAGGKMAAALDLPAALVFTHSDVVRSAGPVAAR